MDSLGPHKSLTTWTPQGRPELEEARQVSRPLADTHIHVCHWSHIERSCPTSSLTFSIEKASEDLQNPPCSGRLSPFNFFLQRKHSCPARPPWQKPC